MVGLVHDDQLELFRTEFVEPSRFAQCLDCPYGAAKVECCE